MSCPEPTAVLAVLIVSAVLPRAAGAGEPEPSRADLAPPAPAPAGQETPRERPQAGSTRPAQAAASTSAAQPARLERIKLFLCGDVMTGRGIDQVLPRPCDPRIREPYVTNAREYVRLAERAHGRIDRPVKFPYIWGDGLEVLRRARPHVHIVNLETSVTRSDRYWKGKGIHYRMSPENVGCLTAAGLDVCTLANNHVLDWGYPGLAETLETLARARVKTAGAGKTLAEARAPAVCPVAPNARVLVFSLGCTSSGVPRAWAAAAERAGVHLLPALPDAAAENFARLAGRHRRAGDVVVASIHWGGNWGYRVPAEQRRFARRLIDSGGVDVVHGHSSHHAKGIEVHRGKLILYGCGDLINDYEGISGHEAYRGDLGLMYFATVSASTGRLEALRMVPTQMRRFRLRRASRQDAAWLCKTLDRECRRLGARVTLAADHALKLHWARPGSGRVRPAG